MYRSCKSGYGYELLKCRDKARLKWWYQLASMPEDRYPKQLL